MELRHLRCFVAVADAEKIRMEPMRNHPRNVSVYACDSYAAQWQFNRGGRAKAKHVTAFAQSTDSRS